MCPGVIPGQSRGAQRRKKINKKKITCFSANASQDFYSLCGHTCTSTTKGRHHSLDYSIPQKLALHRWHVRDRAALKSYQTPKTRS